jgi:hypothetical protein
MTEAENQEEIQIGLAIQKPMKRKMPKNIEADTPKGLGTMGTQTGGSQPTLEEPCVLEKKPEASAKVIVPEHVQVPQQNKVEIAPVQQLAAVETKTISQSSSGCQYGFGYLSQREKGEGIPDTCIECPKSLNCMLSEYYKAESVKEIKKWYNL